MESKIPGLRDLVNSGSKTGFAVPADKKEDYQGLIDQLTNMWPKLPPEIQGEYRAHLDKLQDPSMTKKDLDDFINMLEKAEKQYAGSDEEEIRKPVVRNQRPNKLLYYRALDEMKKRGQVKIFEHLARCRLFVIPNEPNFHKEVTSQEYYRSWMESKAEPLRLPFEAVAFEYEIEMDSSDWDNIDELTDQKGPFMMQILFCVLEKSPNEYTFIQVTSDDVFSSDERMSVDWRNSDGELDTQEKIDCITRDKEVARQLSAYVSKHRKAEDPQTPVRSKSIRAGKKKRTYQLNPIIYVSPRAHVRQVERTLGRKMDWNFSFEVRGHWRSVKGIGKDEQGVYRMQGLTWVKPFTKGKGQLVKKTRVMK